MADVWEIARYVEDNPDNNKQRWRLAKKLYKAGEYRLALEHLQVLKKEWHSRVNVIRYLAATLFRLTRYSEAVDVLRDALTDWSDEIGLHEQLARALEVDGRRREAIRVWRDVIRLMPRHPSAEKAIARLQASMEGQDTTEAEAMPGRDAAFMMIGEVTCQTCGAQNASSFERCWQCNTPLADGDVLSSSNTSELAGAGHKKWENVGFTLASVVLLLLGLFLTIQFTSMQQRHDAGQLSLISVYDLLAVHFIPARCIIGVLLLIGWPIALWVGLRVVQAQRDSLIDEIRYGVFLSVLTYLVSWAPIPLLPIALILPLVASLILITFLYRLPIIPALTAWAIQGVLVLTLAGAAFWVTEGAAPCREFPHIKAYAHTHKQDASAGTVEVGIVTTPHKVKIAWDSTGSPWLDARGKQVGFHIEPALDAGRITFELRSEEETAAYIEVEEKGSTLAVDVEPNKEYHMALRGETGDEVRLAIFSMLSTQIE